MTDTTYNGWSNYATWRINLEMFDGMSPADIAGNNDLDAHMLGNLMSEQAHDIMEAEANGLALDYARAFLANVNWYEIAQHKIRDYEDA